MKFKKVGVAGSPSSDTNESTTVSLPHAEGWSDLDSHSMKCSAILLSSYKQVSEMLATLPQYQIF